MFAGNKIKLSLFGESHGSHIGITIEGIPAGVKLDNELIERQMQRRRSVNQLSTPRREPDLVNIISGVTNGITNGGTITGIIENTNTKSKDYQNNLPRPSHADYTGRGRFDGFNDYRGGGFFSGRLTAPLTFAGAICKQLLASEGVVVGTHVQRIHNVCDESFDLVKTNKETLYRLSQMEIPVLDPISALGMQQAILKAKNNQDSVGGVLESMAIGMPEFVGGAYFDRLQAKLSRLVFSIPAFVGLEFGLGFDSARLFGSEMNDEIYYDGQEVKTITNNSGGINGGITNGMPIVLRAAVRPTPSIGIKQKTIDLNTKQNTEIEIQGRHDPCIAIRAAVVIESMVAIGLYDEI